MRNLKTGAVILFTLVLGVLGGIGLDWSTWLSGKTRLVPQSTGVQLTARRGPTYETEAFNQAYVFLLRNQTFSLARADGGSPQPFLYFDDGEDPCTQPDGTSSQCTIASNAPLGVYFFSCNANGAAYNCPDPGIVVRDAPPIQNILILQAVSYSKDLRDIVRHVLGKNPRLTIDEEAVPAELKTESQGFQEKSGSKSKSKKDVVGAPTQVEAHVVCPNNGTKTVDIFPAGSPGTATLKIPVPQGSSLTWVANYSFTMTFLGSSPYLCGSQTISGSKVDGIYQATCNVPTNATVNSYSYTAVAGTCTTPASETISVTAAAKTK
jgi:hypothetical protein